MGTSIKSPFGALYTEDHPHAYGDKNIHFLLKTRQRGSSPRVWGQAQKANDRKPMYRIIPTRMGTRALTNNTSNFSKDHPHAYGDKSLPEELTRSIPGSSPRVWGQAEQLALDSFTVGIIPTRMGTSRRVHTA